MKQIFTLFLMLIPVSFSLMSCATTSPFDRAVQDASVVSEKDVYPHLIAVHTGNPDLTFDNGRVLVVMWKSRDSYERVYKDQTATADSEAYVTWVTTAPQVRRFGKAFLSARPGTDRAALEKRLKQYLGLKPEWTYDVFVELWVDPADMFRPCVDPEIDDGVCNTAFSDPLPRVAGIADYPGFYKNLYFQDFRTRPGVPWTGLGYTYDWGNPGHPFGASEFILRPGAPYTIHRVVDTMDYFTGDPE
ncbi:MAG: hypothetical protein MI802_19320 [Desulfobacterales bacterium]|nr:hypothetical protein [Desulfobacterales bacterium]